MNTYTDTRAQEQRDADEKWYLETLANERLRQRKVREERKVRKALSDEAMRRFDVSTKEGRAAALAFLQAQ